MGKWSSGGIPHSAFVLHHRAVEVLAAVIFLHESHGRVVVRDVSGYLGRNLSDTYDHLRTLKRYGLVTWDNGKSATLRPLVGFIDLT